MSKRVLIKVTKKDIKNGVRHDGNKCPITLAIARKFPNKPVCICSSHGHVGKDFCQFGKSVRRFIENFDKGESVKPFNFYLMLPDNLPQSTVAKPKARHE